MRCPTLNDVIPCSFGTHVELFLPPAIRRMGESNSFSLFTFRGGGTRSSLGRGSPRSQIFGGVPGLRFSGGGYPVSGKGKIFDTRFGLIHVQTGKKFFVEGPPPPSKGKHFLHQIWLDTCSDWEKNFLSRDPPPVKGNIFYTRFGLIHVQTGKNFFCRGTLPQ